MKTTQAKIPDNKIVGKVEIKIRTRRPKRGGIHSSKKRYNRKHGKSIE